MSRRTPPTTIPRRELLETMGTRAVVVAASPLIDGFAVPAQALPLAAVAGPDRVVLLGGVVVIRARSPTDRRSWRSPTTRATTGIRRRQHGRRRRLNPGRRARKRRSTGPMPVPAGWNGTWPPALQTVPERTGFTRTTSSLQLLEFISALKQKSENVHVVNMFISPLGKSAPAIVLASPRITSAQQARDIAAGKRKSLLDNQIVMIAPIFNVDGTDTFVTQDGSLGSETPYILGVRENSQGLDLNRDAVKLRTVEAKGLYRVLNEWDPVLLLDGHLMSRVSHGYANTYGTTTVPAAAAGPRDYTHDTLFPAVRDMVRRDFGLDVFTHALSDRQWPPTVWSHDRAAWTAEAKFIVNDYGLRNRLAIITETPGQPTSNGASTRSTRTCRHCSTTRTRTRRTSRLSSRPLMTRPSPKSSPAPSRERSRTGWTASTALAARSTSWRIDRTSKRVSSRDESPQHASRHR